MCVLKLYSYKDSFKQLAETTNIPVYSTHEKGDYKNKIKKILFTDFQISFDVSDENWDNLDKQIEDTILFLEKHFEEIKKLFTTHAISDSYLDFPIYSRLNGNIVNQNNHLPKELIVLAGKLSLGIEMAIYSKDAFDFLEKK